MIRNKRNKNMETALPLTRDMLRLFCTAANEIANNMELKDLLYYAQLLGVITDNAADACVMLREMFSEQVRLASSLQSVGESSEDDLLELHFDPSRTQVGTAAHIPTADNRGLFARKDTSTGVVIAQMERPVLANEDDVMALSFPGDTGYFYGTTYIWDRGFRIPPGMLFDSNRPESAQQHIPTWWRMNHAPSRPGNPIGAANVNARYVLENGQRTFRFIARRKIHAGEEILLCYGDVPREWDRESDRRRGATRGI
jgi:hypothetical protein